MAALLASALLAAGTFAAPVSATPRPGGPLGVGGPSLGIPGVPLTWDPATMPVQYRIDPGPMAKLPSGTVVIDNAAAIARVNSMFATWSNVATASLSTNYAGALLASGAYTGGPVVNGSNDLANYNALRQSCINGQQSPIIFDPNGNLAAALGLSSGIIGFSSSCSGNTVTGRYKTSEIFLEGKYQDGVNTSSNHELTSNQFNQAITHEIGHLFGLDHSQINVDVLGQQSSNCNTSEVAGLPIMFPFAFCQDRLSLSLPALAPDDIAWISRLYPVTAPAAGKTITSSAYGTISGTVFFSDGITHAQGVNVIARSTSNPLSVAFSAVSGYLFTANIGQSVTCGVAQSSCNTSGSSLGTRDTRFVGTFDIPVTPGTYTVLAESINPNFAGGSSVGPLDVPVPMPGTAPSAQQVSVVAGGSVTANITLQGTASRFDSFESSELILRDSFYLWLRRDQLPAGTVAL